MIAGPWFLYRIFEIEQYAIQLEFLLPVQLPEPGLYQEFQLLEVVL